MVLLLWCTIRPNSVQGQPGPGDPRVLSRFANNWILGTLHANILDATSVHIFGGFGSDAGIKVGKSSDYFRIYHDGSYARWMSARDIYIDPTWEGAVNAVIVPCATVVFEDYLGDKITFYSDMYKIGISPYDLDITSEQYIKWHSDTNNDAMVLDADVGDATVERDFAAARAIHAASGYLTDLRMGDVPDNAENLIPTGSIFGNGIAVLNGTGPQSGIFIGKDATDYFRLYHDGAYVRLSSWRDIYLDPTWGGVASGVIVPQAEVVFEDEFEDKVSFYSDTYKIGISPQDFDLTSDLYFRFHSDENLNGVVFNADVGSASLSGGSFNGSVSFGSHRLTSVGEPQSNSDAATKNYVDSAVIEPDFQNGGEAGGADRTLGNTDSYALGFKTSNEVRINIEGNGRVSVTDSDQDAQARFQVGEALYAMGYYSLSDWHSVTAGGYGPVPGFFRTNSRSTEPDGTLNDPEPALVLGREGGYYGTYIFDLAAEFLLDRWSHAGGAAHTRLTIGLRDSNLDYGTEVLYLQSNKKGGVGAITDAAWTIEGYQAIKGQSNTPTNIAGYGLVYYDTDDDKLYFEDQNGVTYDLTATGGGGGITGNDGDWSLSGEVMTATSVAHTVQGSVGATKLLFPNATILGASFQIGNPWKVTMYESGGDGYVSTAGDLYLDPDGSDVFLSDAALRFTPDAYGDKVYLHGANYKIGVSENDIDYTSDLNHRFHSDTLSDLLVIDGTEGDVTVKDDIIGGGDVTANGQFQFGADTYDDKIYLYGSVYKIAVSYEDVDYYSDRWHKFHSNENTDAFKIDALSGEVIAEATGYFTGIDLQSTGRLRGLQSPVFSDEAATKAYVDGAAGGGSGSVGGYGSDQQVAYWIDSVTLSGEAAFTYNYNTNTLTADNFSGNGSSLTSVNADTLDGIDSSSFLQDVPSNSVTNDELDAGTSYAGYVLTAGAGNSLQWTNKPNYYLTGLSFDTNTGILTAHMSGTSDQFEDLDGRYALEGNHTHPASDITAGVFASASTYTFQAGLNIGGELDVGGHKITNLDTPTLADDAATKGYVDGIAGGGSGSVGGSGADKRVAFWVDSVTLSSEAAFTYDYNTNTLDVDNITVDSLTASGGTISGLSSLGVSGNVTVSGNISVSGLVDGRDISGDGNKLDGIEDGADVTDWDNVKAAMDFHYSSGTGIMVRTTGPAYTLIADNSSNWDTAYAERGSQIAGGFLTWDGSELDVVMPADDFTQTEVNYLRDKKLSDGSTPWTSADNITSGTLDEARLAKADNWNAAFSWGDHRDSFTMNGGTYLGVESIRERTSNGDIYFKSNAGTTLLKLDSNPSSAHVMNSTLSVPYSGVEVGDFGSNQRGVYCATLFLLDGANNSLPIPSGSGALWLDFNGQGTPRLLIEFASDPGNTYYVNLTKFQ